MCLRHWWDGMILVFSAKLDELTGVEVHGSAAHA